MKKEFFEFLIHPEVPPMGLQEAARKDIVLSFHWRSIVLKFFFFQLVGALFSMTVCPQFGLGLAEGHGITHSFRMIGDWACALFCGSLFLSSGTFMAYIGMKGEELWWVWRRYKFGLIFLPALFWGMLMFFNLGHAFESENLAYHMLWILSAIAFLALWMQLRSAIFLRSVTSP